MKYLVVAIESVVHFICNYQFYSTDVHNHPLVLGGSLFGKNQRRQISFTGFAVAGVRAGSFLIGI